MISHKYQCIFVHIPKTAGKSIEIFFADLQQLGSDANKVLLLGKNKLGDKGPGVFTHLKSHEYTHFNYISELQFHNYFKFSFVRNPWDRAVSFYKYRHYHLFISFKRYVEKELPLLFRDENHFYGPQYDYIYHQNEQLVDFIGRYEKIEKDFRQVCQKLNISYTGLTHINKSIYKRSPRILIRQHIKHLVKRPSMYFYYGSNKINSKDYKDYFDRHLIQQIHDIYYQDIEAFNYRFEET